MLDQNTDRMWYVIGAVIVGAALIFLMNNAFPTMFANVGETFEDKTEQVTVDVEKLTMTDGIKPVIARPNLLSRVLVSHNPYTTHPEWTSEDTFKVTAKASPHYFTLKGFTYAANEESIGDYTLSGYLSINGRPASKENFGTPDQISTYFHIARDDASAVSVFHADTGYFSITQRFTNATQHWPVHTRIWMNEGDVLVFKQLKLEYGSNATPYRSVQ